MNLARTLTQLRARTTALLLDNFANYGSLLRIAFWCVVSSAAILYVASLSETQASRDTAHQSRPDVPLKIAVVGSSESAGYRRGRDESDNLADHLARELLARGYDNFIVCDFAELGLTAVDIRSRVQNAVDERPDVVIVTASMISASYYFGNESTMLREQPRAGLFQSPSSIVDRALRDIFAGYESGFPNTLGRAVGFESQPGAIGRELTVQAAPVTERSLYPLRALSSVTAPAERAIAVEPPSDPRERLRLLVQPALDAGTSVLFVTTPVNRESDLADFWVPFLEFEQKFRDFDDNLADPDQGLYYWPAYREDWTGRLEFRDPSHIATPAPYASRMLDALASFDLLPDIPDQRGAGL